jgi:hypothetical protein
MFNVTSELFMGDVDIGVLCCCCFCRAATAAGLDDGEAECCLVGEELGVVPVEFVVDGDIDNPKSSYAFFFSAPLICDLLKKQ